MESPPQYSPHLRTALVLTGTGTAGAYHAGVLHALHEAGVKIDLVAGRGVGVVGAMFAAVDGAARLWEPGGLWRADGVGRLYRWRATLQAATWTIGVALGAVLLPLLALGGAVIAFPIAFFLRLVGLEAGESIVATYGRWLDAIFDPTVLPVYLPRLVVVAVLALLVLLVTGAVSSALRARTRRRARGALWWRLLGTPFNVSRAVAWFSSGLWQNMRGAARIAKPSSGDLGQRYAELLAENVGQPGFRELLLVAHDVDARRDMVFALLAEPHRRSFFMKRLDPAGRQRQLETVDLMRDDRRHALDALAGALSLPVVTEPHLVTFAADSVWRGETHRLCDRPEGTARLLEEVAIAEAEQVILVAALQEPPGPHTLSAGRRDVRGRAGEHLASLETASLHDAVAARGGLFQAVFQVRPTHNPLGPFDFTGCYDERSDRRQTLAELVDRGYEDGFLQFVDAVVGASGEWMKKTGAGNRPGTTGPSISERLAAHGGAPPSQ